MTRLDVGEHFARIEIRYEDPVNLGYEILIGDFVESASQRMNKIGALLEGQVSAGQAASMSLRA